MISDFEDGDGDGDDEEGLLPVETKALSYSHFFLDSHHLSILRYLEKRVDDDDLLLVVSLGLSSLLDIIYSNLLSKRYKPYCIYFDEYTNPLDLIKDERFPNWVEDDFFKVPIFGDQKSPVALQKAVAIESMLHEVFEVTDLKSPTEVFELLLRYLAFVYLQKVRGEVIYFSGMPIEGTPSKKSPPYCWYNVFDIYEFPFLMIH